MITNSPEVTVAVTVTEVTEFAVTSAFPTVDFNSVVNTSVPPNTCAFAPLPIVYEAVTAAPPVPPDAKYVLIVSILGCSKVDSSKEPTEPSKPSENIEFQDNIDTEVDEKIPAHSQLYNSNYTQDKILTYFKEVVLNMEYIDGTGDVSCVQKWLSPIYYNIYGSYTDDNLTKLYELFTQLNDINGFPGIYPASDENIENLTISFLEPNDFTYQFSDVINGEDAFGATEFWYYTDTNEIHTARIGYRTD